jgi:hypothetical protein
MTRSHLFCGLYARASKLSVKRTGLRPSITLFVRLHKIQLLHGHYRSSSLCLRKIRRRQVDRRITHCKGNRRPPDIRRHLDRTPFWRPGVYLRRLHAIFRKSKTGSRPTHHQTLECGAFCSAGFRSQYKVLVLGFGRSLKKLAQHMCCTS